MNANKSLWDGLHHLLAQLLVLVSPSPPHTDHQRLDPSHIPTFFFVSTGSFHCVRNPLHFEHLPAAVSKLEHEPLDLGEVKLC